ncbi:ATP-binding domain-containing protein [Ramlibacter rhizophilus]|uniref:ATP-binding domain-containing protein n=1 Tax=Ramlibacter rhizophilus TaxID=1781167 RepID=UPI0019825E46
MLDTVQRFKGLESPVVILWGIDGVAAQGRQELLYVGMSRAKSILLVVGSAVTCALVGETSAKPR